MTNNSIDNLRQIIMDKLPQVKPTVIPSKRSAATFYLASLAPSGRRAIMGRLQSIADMFNCPFDSMPWHELRYEHLAAIRTELQESELAPSTSMPARDRWTRLAR